MAEKDPSARLRRAVKDNNLFLVKRLVQRLVQKSDMRNTDPTGQRYTSLAWAAVLGNEETFEYLLTEGHDDNELSRDSEGDSVLMLLADQTPPGSTPHNAIPGSSSDTIRAALRMARLYYDRYPDVLDYANTRGRTALHIAVQRGNEALVRTLCEFGADVDLSDEEGNTPLHYASMWGHVPIVQLLIENGCSYSAKNNVKFTASDYAYSIATRDTLQNTALTRIEKNKETRKALYQQAARPGEWGNPPNLSPTPSRPRDLYTSENRLRSGSGTSRTTNTSDSGEYDASGLAPPSRSQSSVSASSSPPLSQNAMPPISNSNSTATLTAFATRVRERDANAMEQYMRRNRSESQGTSSTDTKSQNGSTFAIETLSSRILPSKMVNATRRLRPSTSAQQLRSTGDTNITAQQHQEYRSRAGTNPTIPRQPTLSRSSSTSTSPHVQNGRPDQSLLFEEPEKFTGPPSQYAHFPEPPLASTLEESITPTARRMALYQTKPNPTLDAMMNNHRRGMSAASR